MADATTYTNPPAPTPADAPRSGGVEGIVREIQAELAGISAYEVDLRRREQAFSQEYRRLEHAARTSARAEVELLRQQLARQTAALNARAAELKEERRRVDQRASAIHDDERRLLTYQVELERDAARLQTRTERTAAQIRSRRERLRRRIDVVRAHEAELTRRVRLARDEIVQQRASLAMISEELERRAIALGASEAELSERRAAMNHTAAEGVARIVDAQQRQTALAAEYARLEAERERLRKLEQQTAERQSRLDAREQAATHAEARLNEGDEQRAREQRRLEAERAALLDERARVEERRAALASREHELREKQAALESQRLRIDRIEAEHRERQFALDAARASIEQQERQAREHLDAALEARERGEAHESDARHAAMAIEVERQQLVRDRTVLSRLQAEFDDRRAARDAEISAVRVQLEAWSARLATAGPAARGPVRWPQRAAWLAGAAAAAAFAGWLFWHPPRFEATVQVHRVGGAAADSPADAALLAAELERPELLNDPQSDPALGRAWREAITTRGAAIIDAQAGPDPRGATLRVIDRDKHAAELLARSAAEACARRLNAAPSGPSPELVDQERRESELAASLAMLEQERAAAAADLEREAGPEARARVVDAASAAERNAREVSAALDERRDSLAALLAQPASAHPVAEADVDAALAEEIGYQEDTAELTTITGEFRDAVEVAAVLLRDPLEALAAALSRSESSIDEQLGLAPPDGIVATLKQCQTDAARLRAAVNDFASAWRGEVEWVQKFKLVREDIAGSARVLSQRQVQMAEASARLSAAAGQAGEAIAARIDSLSARGDGSTREMVVASVLRSDHAAVRAAVQALSDAAAQLSTATSVALDAGDRQSQAIRARIEQRRGLVKERLRLAAERNAGAQHAAAVDAARAEIRALEQRREASLREATTKLAEADRMTAGVERHELAHAALRAIDQRRDALAAERDALSARIAELRAAAGDVPHVEISPVRAAAIADTRFADASWAALAAGVAAYAVSALAGIRFGRPREQVDIERLIAGDETDGAPIRARSASEG